MHGAPAALIAIAARFRASHSSDGCYEMSWLPHPGAALQLGYGAVDVTSACEKSQVLDLQDGDALVAAQ